MDTHYQLIKKLIPELLRLEEIEKYMESVEERLEKIYAERFPKKCSSCQRIYLDRKEYLQATKKIFRENYPDGNMESNGKIAEYRNCVCGSTLLVLTTCRRDRTELGAVRRDLFMACRDKLVSEFEVPSHIASYCIRLIFNGFRNRILSIDKSIEDRKVS